MLKRVVRLLIAFPVALLLITLAVANRHTARLILDPFRPEQPALSVEMPFYFYLSGAPAVGGGRGGLAVLRGQPSSRLSPRQRAQDSARWRAEADRLARERDEQVVATGGSPARALAVVRH